MTVTELRKNPTFNMLLTIATIAAYVWLVGVLSLPVWAYYAIVAIGFIYLGVFGITTDLLWPFRKILWRTGNLWMKVHAAPDSPHRTLIWQKH